MSGWGCFWSLQGGSLDRHWGHWAQEVASSLVAHAIVVCAELFAQCAGQNVAQTTQRTRCVYI
jgi:hypothetical protein